MKLLFVVLALALGASAQNAALSSSTLNAVYPGAPLTVDVTLTGSLGLNIAALSYNMFAGASGPTVGPASTAAGKTVFFSAGKPVVLLLSPLLAPNKSVYSDGVVSSLLYTVPAGTVVGSVIDLATLSPYAADSSGATVNILSMASPVTVGMSPACFTFIQAEILAFELAPSQALLGQIVANLATGLTGGVCK